MALQLASLLDQAVLWEDWSAKIQNAVNVALGEISVQPNYRVMVSIATRTYHLTSGLDGRLQITPLTDGRNTEKALAQAQVRVVIDSNAFEGRIDVNNSQDLMTKRYLRIEGDSSKVFQMQQELDPHFEKILARVEAQGPGKDVLEKAVTDHNAQVLQTKVFENETFQYELSCFKDAHEMDIMELPWDPLLSKQRGWVFFSAGSTMMGNMGQANYVAANILLDAATFSMRTTTPSFEAITLMWGAVSNLGMRWKAFASQDMLLQAENSAEIMLSPSDAGGVLRYVVSGICPEWTAGWKMDAATLAYFQGDQQQSRHPDPWGWSKSTGKGGGITVHSPSIEENQDEAQLNCQNASASDAHSLKLFPGRRIRIQGLLTRADLNGTKGTLVDEVGLGKWQVRLDGGLGDKLLKVENMAILAGGYQTSQTEQVCFGESQFEPHLAEFCLAGTWDDWAPKDMTWDSKQQCFTLRIDVRGNLQGRGFSIRKGKAGTRWKTQRQEWVLGVDGIYMVRLQVKDSGGIKKVDWVRLGDPSPLPKQALLPLATATKAPGAN